MGTDTTFSQVIFKPEANQYASNYTIQVASSAVPTTWTTVDTESSGVGTAKTYNFTPVSARYVKLDVTAEHETGPYGHAVLEFDICNATGIPAAPTGLTFTPGIALMSLSWTASTGATSFKVKRGTASGGPYISG